MGIVVKANGGLGNRMRVLASCIALHERLREEVEVLWVNNEELNCPYNQLFLPISGLKIKDVKYIPKWNRLGLKLRKKSVYQAFKNYDIQFSDVEIRELKEMKSDLVKLIRDAKSVFIDTCEAFYGDQSFLAFLIPEKLVNQEIERRLTIIEHSNYMGVHIRRGDNATSINISTTSAFISKMKSVVSADINTIFYLSTDSKLEVLSLKAAFPNKIVHFPIGLKRNRPSDIRMALVDLLVLSKSKKILGSYWSSFSEVASAYGGIPLESMGHSER
ncbi:MAG: hypothetical protein COA58_07145 [Bacteroidetes bacterium]|nr:MAG: hypothetical protein COA58_07145 [Bacteroidota bacterium]